MLLTYTPSGLYRPEADIYIDPNKAVENAIITHAHSDHARRGSKNYFAHPLTVPILRERVGAKINVAALEYGNVITKNGVKISLHPAGHIPGSAQVRVEHKGEVWVVTGDYKLESDGLTAPYEQLKCHTFITESTFAMPVYKWEKQEKIFERINNWWLKNIEDRKISILTGYSLGKAQRLLKNVNHSIGSIYGHNSITSINELFISAGLNLPEIETINEFADPSKYEGSLIIAPPQIKSGQWLQKLKPSAYSVGFASGWMIHGKQRAGKGVDVGFTISDHADWEGLNLAVKNSGAENIYVTHGFETVLVNWLRKLGYNAYELRDLSKNIERKPVVKQINMFEN